MQGQSPKRPARGAWCKTVVLHSAERQPRRASGICALCNDRAGGSRAAHRVMQIAPPIADARSVFAAPVQNIDSS